MNGKELLKKMDLADPKYIDEADKLPRRMPIMWKQWSALAACLAVTVISAIMMYIQADTASAPDISPSDTATLLGSGGLPLILMILSLLGAGGIAAYIIKNRKK